jgi:cytidine deaminase
MGENGTVYTGCNVENASYGMTVCAERVALFKMISEGCRKFTAIAVATADDGTDGVPCLACRQVMSEFRAEGEVPVYDCDPSGRVFRHTLDELAPMPFTLSAAEEDDDE